MSSNMLLIAMFVGVSVLFTLIYLLVIMQKPVTRKNERCNKMLKQLEDEPYNLTIGEDLYGSKIKKKTKEDGE